MDTYNNPDYGVKSFKADDTKSNFKAFVEQFRKEYQWDKKYFLPWHFFVEIVGREYVIHTCRPFNYQSNFPNNLYKNKITIMVLGDSETDIYMSDIYSKIANMCITPYFHTVPRFPKKISYNISSFSKHQLEKYLV